MHQSTARSDRATTQRHWSAAEIPFPARVTATALERGKLKRILLCAFAWKEWKYLCHSTAAQKLNFGSQVLAKNDKYTFLVLAYSLAKVFMMKEFIYLGERKHVFCCLWKPFPPPRTPTGWLICTYTGISYHQTAPPGQIHPHTPQPQKQDNGALDVLTLHRKDITPDFKENRL